MPKHLPCKFIPGRPLCPPFTLSILQPLYQYAHAHIYIYKKLVHLMILVYCILIGTLVAESADQAQTRSSIKIPNMKTQTSDKISIEMKGSGPDPTIAFPIKE